jgi:putative endopeptidase
MMGCWVGTDDKNSSQYAVTMFQSGTVMPEKSYYLSNDSSMVALRESYKKYVATLFTLIGTPEADAKKAADDILKLETEIAKSHKSMVELRDPIANYNKYAVADLPKLSPNLDWATIHANMGIKTDSVIVGQPNYYKKLSELAKSTPLPILKSKMKAAVLNHAAPYLSSGFANAHFEFHEKTMNGRKEQEVRWKRMSGVVDGSLPELLGQAYVAKHFSPDAKKRMLELVGNLQKAFQARIESLDWMSAETKKRANEKLGAIINKIGYPDKWKKYDDVIVKRDDFFANLISANRHQWKEMTDKLGKPVDKTEWGMSPPTVNAYYNPGINEIVFPAGILQFPFFDFEADDAINYGAIGAVIGHELTHGFDDQGSLYDAQGNLNSWWTPEDRKKFEERTARLAAQYSSYPMLDGELHVNGDLTLGENIADLGGVIMAFEAFKLTEQGKSGEKIDGFTPEQRFFLSYAQVWRFKATEEAIRTRIHTDPHSPGRWRVNGTLTNVPAFHKAFNVQPGDSLYRSDEELVKIW